MKTCHLFEREGIKFAFDMGKCRFLRLDDISYALLARRTDGMQRQEAMSTLEKEYGVEAVRNVLDEFEILQQNGYFSSEPQQPGGEHVYAERMRTALTTAVRTTETLVAAGDLVTRYCFLERAQWDKDIPAFENVLSEGHHILLPRFLQQLAEHDIAESRLYVATLKAIYEGRGRDTTCGAISGHVVRGHDGMLYPCHRYAEAHQCAIGEISRGLDTARYSEYLHRCFASREVCLHCWVAKICGGLCPWVLSNLDGLCQPPGDDRCKAIRGWVEACAWLHEKLKHDWPADLAAILSSGPIDQVVNPAVSMTKTQKVHLRTSTDRAPDGRLRLEPKPVKGVIFAVVVALNCVSETERCLKSLHTRRLLRLVLIDNGSNEASAKAFHDLAQRSTALPVTLIRNSENLGVAAGWNIGIHYAIDRGAQYVLVINNDLRLGRNTIDALADYLDHNDDIELVTGKEYPYSTDLDALADRISYSTARLDMPHYSCFMVRPSLFTEHRLRFDEKYLAYFEDEDHYYRMKQAGLRAVGLPWAPFAHDRGTTGKTNWGRRARRNTYRKSEAYFLSKWGRDVRELSLRYRKNSHEDGFSRSIPAENARKVLETAATSDLGVNVQTLYEYATKDNYKRFVDIGVRESVSSAVLICAANRNDGHVWAIDLDDCNVWATEPRWQFIQGHSVNVGRNWRNGLVDFVFLDTEHRRELTIQELSVWWPLLTEGGIFAFHDTDHPTFTVRQGILEFFEISSLNHEDETIKVENYPDSYSMTFVTKKATRRQESNKSTSRMYLDRQSKETKLRVVLTVDCSASSPGCDREAPARAALCLATELRNLGHDVRLIAQASSEFEVADIPIIDGNPTTPHQYVQDADIVHAHTNGAPAVDYRGVTLTTLHGLRCFYDYESQLAFNDKHCFISKYHRKIHQAEHASPFVYNGIDSQAYIYEEEKDDYFLFLGQLDWEMSGLQVVLDVARSAAIQLVIAGSYHTPDFLRQLRPHLGRRILYVGDVTGRGKAMLLANAKALFFPTMWYEPFGLPVIEAMACGTPVIATYNGAMPELITPRTGFLCRTISEFRHAVHRVGEIRPDECQKRALNDFTVEIMAANYVKLYRRLLSKRCE